VILAGGLHAGNVMEAVGVAHPWGVDACSRLESSPGKKDPKRVLDFVQAALAALQTPEAIVL
jgi:phosphoribosylanthranilate isomerase